ncbi:MAG TPA: hypothetical protein VKN62_07675 [Pelovirga sp.]|nr:hypothetical protein [Pelovirga sp.]
MSEEKYEIICSPLSQAYVSGGKTVEIEIYRDTYGDGGWILEVVDEFGNSTVWDVRFEDDQAALNCVLDTIKKEGIESLIGPPSAG